MSRGISVLCFVLACSLAHAETMPGRTRFDTVVAAVMADDTAAQVAFADIGMDLLVKAHEAEVGALAATRRGGSAIPAQRQWQNGMLGFIERLRRIRQQLLAGAPLQLVREPDGALRMIIGEEQVMLTAPRLSEQNRFEAAIADEICKLRDCAAEDQTVDQVVEARERRLAGEWALGDRAPPMYSQEDGLRCVFADMRHLRLKQDACEAVTRELRLLEESLRAVLQHGGHIDWDALKTATGDARARARVSYAENGRYFELDLPLLSAAPEILKGAIPWLQTRLRGQVANYVITAPERLAYQLPGTD